MAENTRLNHYQAYLAEEFVGEYREGRMARRDLLRRMLAITGSVALTASILSAAGCGSDDDEPEPANTAASASMPAGTPVGPGVAPNDPAIQGSEVTYPGPAGTIKAYVARPNRSGQFPAVVIIHENRGLLDHFRDIARRYAKEGFTGLAVDLASRVGGTNPADPAASMSYTRLPPEDLVADLQASVNYLKEQSFVRANAIGVSGFCFGGGFTWELAIASRDIKASVPYYGTVRQLDRLSELNGPVLALYGETDRFVNPQIPDVEQRLKAAGKTYEMKIYPGAGHSFFNDTGGSYNAAAAADAWQQTTAWFRRYLTG
jgi:carboxymethylenebutenolidase